MKIERHESLNSLHDNFVKNFKVYKWKILSYFFDSYKIKYEEDFITVFGNEVYSKLRQEVVTALITRYDSDNVTLLMWGWDENDVFRAEVELVHCGVEFIVNATEISEGTFIITGLEEY